MSSHLNMLSNILKDGDPGTSDAGGHDANRQDAGQQKPEGQPNLAAAGNSGGGDGIDANGSDDLNALPLPSQNFSQELINATQPMQFQGLSQPDILPMPLLNSQGNSQPLSDPIAQPNAEGMRTSLPMMTNAPALTSSDLIGMFASQGILSGGGGLEQFMGGNIFLNAALANADAAAAAAAAGVDESGRRSKKMTRRGPMDEMRQLIRIMIKIFPQSASHVSMPEEVGGSNRISEEAIRSYLERTLGEAPRPIWGLPAGWFGYLAELFSWGADKVISGEETKRVARREPGRSWEALKDELRKLDVYPDCWPLPMTKAGVAEAQRKRIPLPVVNTAPFKKAAAGATTANTTTTTSFAATDAAAPAAGSGDDGSLAGTKRRRGTTEVLNWTEMDELEIWKTIDNALDVAVAKQNSSNDQHAINLARQRAKQKFDYLVGMGGGAAGGGGNLNQNQMYQLFQTMPGMEMMANMMQNMSQQQQQQQISLKPESGGGDAAGGRPGAMSSADIRGSLLGALDGSQNADAGVQQQQQQQQQQPGSQAMAAASLAMTMPLGGMMNFPPMINLPGMTNPSTWPTIMQATPVVLSARGAGTGENGNNGGQAVPEGK